MIDAGLLVREARWLGISLMPALRAEYSGTVISEIGTVAVRNPGEPQRLVTNNDCASCRSQCGTKPDSPVVVEGHEAAIEQCVKVDGEQNAVVHVEAFGVGGVLPGPSHG